MLERYLLPLGPYLLIACNVILCLIVFVSFESEIRRLKSRLRHPAVDQTPLRDLNRKLEEFSGRLRDAEERAGITMPAPTGRASLNLNKRTQIIRMSRRGEPTEKIATSLSVPRREVELLLKVYGLVWNSPKEIASERSPDAV